jgi:hypothetical protein
MRRSPSISASRANCGRRRATDNEPVPSLVLYVYNSSTSFVKTVEVVTGGVYTVTGLPTGSYFARIAFGGTGPIPHGRDDGQALIQPVPEHGAPAQDALRQRRLPCRTSRQGHLDGTSGRSARERDGWCGIGRSRWLA